MRPLRVNRYKQEPSHCAIGASAAVANYFNRDIDYDFVKEVALAEIVPDVSKGLYSGEIALLLNALGFGKVSIVTCDLDIVDYAWLKLSKKGKLDALAAMIRLRNIDSDFRINLKSLHTFLGKTDRKNEIIIDHSFGDYIRGALDNGPIVCSFNWTMFFRLGKRTDKNVEDFIRGSQEQHAVCIRGYNDEGVHIVDSHHQFYKWKLKKFRDGYYMIPWEEFFTVLGCGDLIIAEDYREELLNYELVQKTK